MKYHNKKFKAILSNFNTKMKIKQMKLYHSSRPELLESHKNLKKYIPPLIELAKAKNDFYFDTSNKADLEQQFLRLMLWRSQDYFESVIISVWSNNIHSLYPLMRALCDSLFLLMYIEKHPNYIRQFMRSKKDIERRTEAIRSEVKNKPLHDYYKYLSDMHHSNPMPVKLNYRKIEESDSELEAIISTQPFNREEIYESTIISLISIYSLEISIMKKICIKN